MMIPSPTIHSPSLRYTVLSTSSSWLSCRRVETLCGLYGAKYAVASSGKGNSTPERVRLRDSIPLDRVPGSLQCLCVASPFASAEARDKPQQMGRQKRSLEKGKRTVMISSQLTDYRLNLDTRVLPYRGYVNRCLNHGNHHRLSA